MIRTPTLADSAVVSFSFDLTLVDPDLGAPRSPDDDLDLLAVGRSSEHRLGDVVQLRAGHG